MSGLWSLANHVRNQSIFIPEPPLTEKNLPDQSGKVFLVTGSNIGVGYEVVRILYQANGTIYMGCRNESKARSAIDSIKSTHPHSKGKLVYLHIDLSDLTTIKAAVTEFLSKESRLDWLNHNAGVMTMTNRGQSKQNHDLQMATNVLGPFLLTKLLQPILKSTAAALSSQPGVVRVSWASSIGTDAMSPPGGVQFDGSGTPGANWKMMVYGASKTANWWLAYEFGKRYGDADRVMHNAYNPGNLRSQLLRHVRDDTGWFGFVMDIFNKVFLYPPVYGAYTELYCGVSEELEFGRDQGRLVQPWGRRSVWNRDDVVFQMREGGGSEKVWNWCEENTKEYL